MPVSTSHQVIHFSLILVSHKMLYAKFANDNRKAILHVSRHKESRLITHCVESTVYVSVAAVEWEGQEGKAVEG